MTTMIKLQLQILLILVATPHHQIEVSGSSGSGYSEDIWNLLYGHDSSASGFSGDDDSVSSGFSGDDGSFQVRGCGPLLFSDVSGRITSPNYPHYYANGLNCSYTISSSEPNSVNITFHVFQTEILHDWVQIRCSNGSSYVSPMFSGRELPPFMSFQSCTQLTVQFYTDNSTISTGFSLSYSVGMGGLTGGIATSSASVVASSDQTEPIVLSCQTNITLDGNYPWWAYTADGKQFTPITNSECALSAQNPLSGVSSQKSRGLNGSECKLTIARAHISNSVGSFVCTDSSLASSSVFVSYLVKGDQLTQSYIYAAGIAVLGIVVALIILIAVLVYKRGKNGTASNNQGADGRPSISHDSKSERNDYVLHVFHDKNDEILPSDYETFANGIQPSVAPVEYEVLRKVEGKVIES